MQLEDVLISPMKKMNITLVLGGEQQSSPVSKMDISTVLNPPDELNHQSVSMEVDSPTSTSYPPRNSPSSPSICKLEFTSPQMTQYPHRLPLMDNLCMKPTESHSRSDSRLPPLRSLFQNISLPSVVITEDLSYCSRLDIEMRRHENRRTHLARRKSHHSGSTSSNSPMTHHHRISRRRSHPQSIWNVPIFPTPNDSHRYQQPVILVEDQDTHYDNCSTPPVTRSKKSKGSHNNKAYTKEQCMWMRYFKVDRGMKFNDMLPLFWEQFPERWDPFSSPEATGQMLSSRYYRDNDRPDVDDEGKCGFDDKGKLRLIKAPVRQQTTDEGKELSFPMTMVDKWPARLLEYDWKLGILEEHKERAVQILAGNDKSDPQGKKAAWRRILNECEEHIYKAEN